MEASMIRKLVLRCRVVHEATSILVIVGIAQ
jgi:hypothetical protein